MVPVLPLVILQWLFSLACSLPTKTGIYKFIPPKFIGNSLAVCSLSDIDAIVVLEKPLIATIINYKLNRVLDIVDLSLIDPELKFSQPKLLCIQAPINQLVVYEENGTNFIHYNWLTKISKKYLAVNEIPIIDTAYQSITENGENRQKLFLLGENRYLLIIDFKTNLASTLAPDSKTTSDTKKLKRIIPVTGLNSLLLISIGNDRSICIDILTPNNTFQNSINRVINDADFRDAVMLPNTPYLIILTEQAIYIYNVEDENANPPNFLKKLLDFQYAGKLILVPREKAVLLLDSDKTKYHCATIKDGKIEISDVLITNQGPLIIFSSRLSTLLVNLNSDKRLMIIFDEISTNFYKAEYSQGVLQTSLTAILDKGSDTPYIGFFLDTNTIIAYNKKEIHGYKNIEDSSNQDGPVDILKSFYSKSLNLNINQAEYDPVNKILFVWANTQDVQGFIKIDNADFNFQQIPSIDMSKILNPVKMKITYHLDSGFTFLAILNINIVSSNKALKLFLIDKVGKNYKSFDSKPDDIKDISWVQFPLFRTNLRLNPYLLAQVGNSIIIYEIKMEQFEIENRVSIDIPKTEFIEKFEGMFINQYSKIVVCVKTTNSLIIKEIDMTKIPLSPVDLNVIENAKSFSFVIRSEGESLFYVDSKSGELKYALYPLKEFSNTNIFPSDKNFLVLKNINKILISREESSALIITLYDGSDCPKGKTLFNNNLCKSEKCTNFYKLQSDECVTSCPNFFSPDSSLCKKDYYCPTSCLVCNSKNDCLVCDSNYFLFDRDKDGLFEECLASQNCNGGLFYKYFLPILKKTDFCLSLVSNIQNCQRSRLELENSCEICNADFYLNLGNCLTSCPAGTIKNIEKSTCDEGCKSGEKFCTKCDPSNSKCQTCFDGYYMAGSLCKKCILINCQKCDYPQNLEVCSQCVQGYLLTQAGCVPCQLENCETCETSTSCTKCRNGYYLLAVNNEKQCNKCDPPLYIKISDGTCKECSVTFTHCKACNPSGFCTECEKNFYLSGNLCKNCDVIIPNCAACSEKYCDFCEKGFYRYMTIQESRTQLCVKNCLGNTLPALGDGDEGVCLPISDCIEFVLGDPVGCSRCKSGYYLKNPLPNPSIYSACTTCTGEGEKVSSENLDGQGKCTDCEVNFCKTCLPNNSKACDTCESGFVKTTDSAGATYCSCSEIGFYYKSDEKKCLPCSDGNCQKCTEKIPCTDCKTDFYFTSDSQKCIECKLEKGDLIYTDDKSQKKACRVCSEKFPNCFQCSSGQEKCLSCSAGYYLIDTVIATGSKKFIYLSKACKSNIPNCRKETKNQKNEPVCEICDDEYYPTEANGIEGATCSICSEQGFILTPLDNKYACKTCSTFTGVKSCSLCTEKSECTKCDKGFLALKSSKDAQIKECVDKCPDSYFNKEGICSSCSAINANCKTCSSSDLSCLGCLDGFFLITSGSGKSCSSCDTSKGYFIDNSEKNGGLLCSLCNSFIKDCELCDSRNNCLKCKTGFFLYSSGTVNYKQCLTACPENEYLKVLKNKISDGTAKCEYCSAPEVYNEDLAKCVLPSLCSVPNCNMCFESINKCTKCKEGFILIQENGTCITIESGCPLKTFLNPKSNLCQSCYETCKKCKGPAKTDCSSCVEPYILVNSSCVLKCAEDEFYSLIDEDQGECKKCNSTCLTCFGENSDECLSCKEKFYLKGSSCEDICAHLKNCSEISTPVTVEISEVPGDSCLIMSFSRKLNMPLALNLTNLVNISVQDLESKDFAYKVERIPEDEQNLKIVMDFSVSVSSPKVQIDLNKEFTASYLKNDLNVNLTIDSNNTNYTQTITKVYANTTKDTKVTSKGLENTVLSLSSFIIFANAFSYVVNIQRISTIWVFADSMQTITILALFNFGVFAELGNFIEKCFFFHADFIAFLGKSHNGTNVTYFGKKLQEKQENTNIFEILGTASFLVNGMQAFAVIIVILVGLFICRFFLWYFNSKGDTEDRIYIFSGNLSNHILWPWLMRFSHFFIQLITASAFIQLKYFNSPSGPNSFLAILALAFYAIYIVYISRAVINSEYVYNDDETIDMNDPVFNGIRTEDYFRRNHYRFIMIKKLLLSSLILVSAQVPSSGLIVALILYFADLIRVIIRNPFKEKRLMVLYFITEIAVVIEILLYLLLAKNQEEMKKKVIIPTSLIEKHDSIGKGVIGLAVFISVLHFIAAFLLFCNYFLKHIDCLCALFTGNSLHLKDPAEERDYKLNEKLDQKIMMELESSTRR